MTRLLDTLADNEIVDKKIAHDFINDLLSQVPYGSGINNKFFINFLDPNSQPPLRNNLQIFLQNWLEQKRILRRALVQALEATVTSEYWTGQMAYLELLKDEIENCHVNLAWESLRQPAMVVGIDLPHSVDSQNSPEIVNEMKNLRHWQGESLRENFLILVAVAIFERQSQPVLRRTYQALNAWFGDSLNTSQRANFDQYFAVHTSISDIKNTSSFEDVVLNIPLNDGVEQNHARLTSNCFVEAKKNITLADLRKASEVFNLINEKQKLAWEEVYQKII